MTDQRPENQQNQARPAKRAADQPPTTAAGPSGTYRPGEFGPEMASEPATPPTGSAARPAADQEPPATDASTTTSERRQPPTP